MPGHLWRDRRGASLVEYVILVGAIAVLCLGVVRIFGGTVTRALDREQRQIASVNGTAEASQAGSAQTVAAPPGAPRSAHTGTSVSGTRAGGSSGGSDGSSHGALGPESSEGNAKNYVIVFIAAAVIVAFAVIKLRRTVGEAPS